jgi:choline dehydrogenase-like flavoprotein
MLMIGQESNNNHVHHIPRGKLLGGSSAINFMAYVRPSSADIDSWNMEGWSFSDLEPYYHKSETLEPGDSHPQANVVDRSKHGKTGPIHTSFPTWMAPIEDVMLPAFSAEAGLQFPPPVDPWSGSHLGFYHGLSTVDRTLAGGVSRSYAATGYLAPILERKNLKILTNAIVTRILLENKKSVQSAEPSITANGVLFQHSGSTYKAVASHEVILSSSTIQSSRLLELSGIGGADILSAAGVECVVNLPAVGENLQEHPMTSVTYELTPGADNITIDSVFLNQELFAEQQRLLESKEGIFASALAMTGFLPYATQVDAGRLQKTISLTEGTHYDKEGQDNTFQQKQRSYIIDQLRSSTSAIIQLIGVAANFDIAKGASNQSLAMSGPPPGRNACYSILVSTMYPLSRGSSHITSSSKSLESSPRIDLGILSHPTDLDVLAAGVAFVDRVLSPSSSVQSALVKPKIAQRIDPAPGVDLQDSTQAKDFIRDRTMIFNHILGTCAMGQVVDARLRVKGVTGLRIVDASVIPSQVGGNILATVYAISEKAADMIKDDYKQSVRRSDLSM